MAYLYTGTSSLGTYSAHRGYVTYSTSETSTAVKITVSDLGEYFSTTASSGSSTTYASGTTTVSATLGSYFTRSGTKSSIGSVTAPKYISFGISSASQTIQKTSSAQTVKLTISWTWNGSTKTSSTNITIPALTSVNCSITYNANGGSGAPSKQTYTYNQPTPVYLSSDVPKRTGYTFLGWSLSSSATTASYSKEQKWSTANKGDYTLYAVWKINSYSIVYNGNSPITGTTPSNVPSAQSKNYGVSVNLSTKVPTLTGYNFTTWNTSSDGKGTNYAPGASYSTNATLSLYAQWKIAHNAPDIKSFTCKRIALDPLYPSEGHEEQYVENDEGTFVRFNLTLAFDNGGTNRTAVIKNGSTTLITINDVGTSETQDYTSTSFSTDSGYTFSLEVSESYEGDSYSTSSTTFLSRAFFIMDFGQEGYAIGIGQAANSSASSSNPRLDIGIPTYINRTTGWTGIMASRTDTNVSVALEVGSGGNNHGIYSNSDDKWIIYNNASGQTYIPTLPRTSSGQTPSNNLDLTTKQYVDNIIELTTKTYSFTAKSAGAHDYFQITWDSTLPNTPFSVYVHTSAISALNGTQFSVVNASTTGCYITYYCPVATTSTISLTVRAYYLNT